jgi:hypothetical protein
MMRAPLVGVAIAAAGRQRLASASLVRKRTPCRTVEAAVRRPPCSCSSWSNHGVAPLPGDTEGRLGLSDIGRAVDFTLGGAAFGRGTYVEAVSQSAVHLQPGVLARIRASPTVRAALDRAVLSVAGVARTFWADEIGSAASPDPLVVAVKRSHVPDRSGDLVFVPARHWVIASAGTNHGTPYEYDTRVPLVFLGAGVAAGRYPDPSAIVDVAPTLAELAGIGLPGAEGRVLSEMFAR